MNIFLTIFDKFKTFGMFVSSIINYILLLVVYTVGVGITWIFVRISGKKLLVYDNKEQKTFWQQTENSHLIEKAKRMF
ncbi:MAG: hypothetical protein HY363_04340 [Candidatus Aenigmarchaeota archaeon]|nr:hypothetical protein [Candidatus Aenigmarchaeota archaeon]